MHACAGNGRVQSPVRRGGAPSTFELPPTEENNQTDFSMPNETYVACAHRVVRVPALLVDPGPPVLLLHEEGGRGLVVAVRAPYAGVLVDVHEPFGGKEPEVPRRRRKNGGGGKSRAAEEGGFGYYWTERSSAPSRRQDFARKKKRIP